MDASSYYCSSRDRVRSVVWKNSTESQHLSVGSQRPSQHKNRRYMLKILRTNPPSAGRRRVSAKCSTRGRSTALKGFETPLDAYENSILPRKARNSSEKNCVLSVNQSQQVKRAHRKHNTVFNGSKRGEFVQDKSETVDKQENVQNFLIVKEKNIYRNRQYQFHTTQRINDKKSLGMIEEGKKCLKSNEYKDAMTYFDQAYQLNSQNLDALLYKGIAQIKANMAESAIKTLECVISKQTKLNSTAYIILAKAYKRMNNVNAAISALTSGLKLNEKQYEAWVLRGELYVLLGKWEEGKSDFERALEFTNSSLAAHIGLANCEEHLNNHSKALSLYKKIVGMTENVHKSIYMKKLNLELFLKEYDNALMSVDTILKKESDEELYMIKGCILEKKGLIEDAALHYEQVTKSENSDLSSRALFKLGKIKLRQKDYYEAHFDFKRIKNPNPKIELYRILVDGIVSLMKKKHKIGTKYLTSIESKITVFKSNIRFIYHTFKAYGYMTQHKFSVSY